MARRRSLFIAAALASAAAITVPIVGLVPAQGSTSTASVAQARGQGEHITVGNTTCAARWWAPNAGRDHFLVVNSSSHLAVVYLFHPLSGKIVARVRHLKAGHSREIVARLLAGETYMWGCDLAGRPPRTSETATVPRAPNYGGPGPPVVPITSDELVGPLDAYRAYVRRNLELLETQIAALESDIDDGELSAAESAWLTAHLTWLAIGQDDGAYGAFGELGREIDGTSAGLLLGTADPHFVGFHKIEFDLWTRDDLASARTDVIVLSQSVSKLTTEFPKIGILGSDLPIRCHEVLEDALRDSLSGNDDYGSGTDLASVLADVAATRELLGLLGPLLEPRSPHLVGQANAELDRLVAAVDATRSGGQWVAVTALGLSQREQVDGDTGAVLETLSRVPDLLQIGRS